MDEEYFVYLLYNTLVIVVYYCATCVSILSNAAGRSSVKNSQQIFSKGDRPSTNPARR